MRGARPAPRALPAPSGVKRRLDAPRGRAGDFVVLSSFPTRFNGRRYASAHFVAATTAQRLTWTNLATAF